MVSDVFLGGESASIAKHVPSRRHGDINFGQARSEAPVHIHTFGGLALFPLKHPRLPLPSTRLRQLLRWVILASWGPALDVSTVCDAMWPNVDGDAAISNFASTIRRLRVVLGSPSSLIVERGTVRLNPNFCSTDLDILQVLQNHPIGNFSSEQVVRIALRMLSDFKGGNSVLYSPVHFQEMATRIETVEAAWRYATLQLAKRLQAIDDVALAAQLCERLDLYGLVDEKVLMHWKALAVGVPTQIISNPGLSQY